MQDGKDLALMLLKEPSERDLQKTIGASSFGSPCGYCVAAELAGTKDTGLNHWWMGAVLGTAVHGFLEDREAEMLDPEDTIIEQKIILGELEGYGVISSKPDLFQIRDKVCRDWKTSNRTKIKFLREAWRTDPDPLELSSVSDARFTFTKYQNQLLSYGRGLVLAGYEVEHLNIVFVNRDGLTDDDIWSVTFPYDQAQADAVWDRLVAIWAYICEGKDIEDITSHRNCYACSKAGRV